MSYDMRDIDLAREDDDRREIEKDWKDTQELWDDSRNIIELDERSDIGPSNNLIDYISEEQRLSQLQDYEELIEEDKNKFIDEFNIEVGNIFHNSITDCYKQHQILQFILRRFYHEKI